MEEIPTSIDVKWDEYCNANGIPFASPVQPQDAKAFARQLCRDLQAQFQVEKALLDVTVSTRIAKECHTDLHVKKALAALDRRTTRRRAAGTEGTHKGN